MAVSFTVPMAYGLQRPRHTNRGITYDTRRNIEAKRTVAALYRQACRLDGVRTDACAPPHVPVAVDIVMHRPLPASRPRRVEAEEDTFKPDIDNVVKWVLDGLNGVAWADDAQVVQLHARKLPRTRLLDEHTTVTIRRPDWGDR